MEPRKKTAFKTELDAGLRWLRSLSPQERSVAGSSYLLPPLAEAGPTDSLCQELGTLPLQKLGESKCTGVRL